MCHSICLIAFGLSCIPAVDLVSDPPTQLSMPSQGAEPSSESAASLTLDLLHGTVFHTTSIKSMTLVFSIAASKLNYFIEHTSLVLVSAPGRSVNSAIEMTTYIITGLGTGSFYFQDRKIWKFHDIFQEYTVVSRMVTFPDGFSWKDVSRVVIFPNNTFPGKTS